MISRSVPPYKPLNWYDAPLLYDIIFDAGTKQEAAFLEAALEKHGTSGGRKVLEPACGTGRLLTALAKRGFQVTGCDVNKHMLDFARRRLNKAGLRATLVQQPMQDFCRPNTFDMAHCLVSTFKYLLTERDAVAHLRNVARSLKPGGIYVLGFHLAEYADRRQSVERWTESRGGTMVKCSIRGWPASRKTRTERLRSRMVVHRCGNVERYETNWLFRSYGPRQVRTLFNAVPQLEHIATYNFEHRIDRPATLHGDSLDLVFILRRKSV